MKGTGQTIEQKLDVLIELSQKLLALENEPRPLGASKLEGSDAYRIRVGDYRVVYLIDDRAREVELIRVAHRREVYR